MTPEKTQALITKYPKLYLPNFWFECSDGWYELIDQLSSDIQNHSNENKVELVHVSQVKEKFGGLRFYLNLEDEHIYHLIQTAENKSLTTCEYCGLPAERKSNKGWITTMCSTCHERQRAESIHR